MKAIFAVILTIVVVGSVVFLRSDRPVSKKDAAVKTYVVNQGNGVRDIAQGLKTAGLIRSERFFVFTAWLRGDKGKFAPGTFELSPSMSTGEIERILIGHPMTNEREITILEGWTLDDIADYLEAEGLASPQELYAEAGESAKFAAPGSLPEWAPAYSALKDLPANASLEGYLFPDTYRIYADGGAKAIVRRMLENFEVKLTPELRAEIASKGRSVREIVIMASVIEREVRGAEDRAMVSDLFWKRVDAGQGLNADSTVNYITGHSKPSVSFAETKIDHPWNTYKYRGLPAGPIGNPGMSAILAAIRPKSNPYWYFLTDKDGNVHYAKTLEEHNVNTANYLR